MLTLLSKIKKAQGFGLIFLFSLLTVIVYGNLPSPVITKAEVDEPVQETVTGVQETQQSEEKPKLERTVLWAPLAGTVSQGRGWVYSSLYGEWYYHEGQDLLAQPDQLVQACLGGIVRQVTKGPNGVTLEIESDRYKIRYASLSESYVTQGQTVRQGEALGLPGQSELEPFTHVHMEVYYDKQMIEAF